MDTDLLMLRGVVAHCADCGDEGLFVPVDDAGPEHCCTRCDAAVLLVEVVDEMAGPAARGLGATA